MSDPVLSWARTTWPGRAVIIEDRSPLTGGVSGATVERVGLVIGSVDGLAPERVDVVLKRTEQQEVDALLSLAELSEPAIPPVLWRQQVGAAGDGVWLILPWYDAEPLGLVAEIPESALRVIARVHRAFIDRPGGRSTSLEAVDPAFCRRALAEFLPGTARRAESAASAKIGRRALALADCLLADAAFVEAPAHFPATLLHGDLYGLNVLRPRPPAADLPDAIVIDWNTARVGPGMFDVAISEPGLDSPGARAYVDEWRALDGPERDFEAEFAWASILLNTIYAVVVADRGNPPFATQMVDRAESAYARYGR